MSACHVVLLTLQLFFKTHSTLLSTSKMICFFTLNPINSNTYIIIIISCLYEVEALILHTSNIMSHFDVFCFCHKMALFRNVAYLLMLFCKSWLFCIIQFKSFDLHPTLLLASTKFYILASKPCISSLNSLPSNVPMSPVL